MKKFEGVMPALITPLLEDESLNTPVVEQLIEDLLLQGADGFYVGGATGEGISLRREVREALAEAAVKATAGRKPCIIHVASTDFSEALALAKQAEACGADAISAIPPLFFSYDEEDVYSYYKKLSEASGLPLMVYYNPNAGFPMTAEFAAHLFEIPNVTAIKWTSSNYFGVIRLKDLTHGEMNVINGPDEMLLMGLSAGADGGIGTTYNFQMPLIRRIYDCFSKGDIAGAQAAQNQADRNIAALLRHCCIPATKAILEKMGYPVGNAAFPQKRYNEAEKQAIFETLDLSF